MNFEYYFDKILDFYKVSTIKELALAIDTGASTISNWKQRNSITALKKKSRELGIYNEIFGDLNSKDNTNLNNKITDIDIDETTLSLVKEAYKKAKSSNNVKGLRIYLMDFDEETEIIMPPKKVEKLTLNEFKNTLEDIKAKSK